MDPMYTVDGHLLTFDVRKSDGVGLPVTINAANVAMVSPYGEGALIHFLHTEKPMTCVEPYGAIRAMFRGLNEWHAWKSSIRLAPESP
jgi:hypothetical protein